MSDEIVVVEVDDDLFPDTPEPVHTDRPATVARPTGPSWSTIALLCVACLWIGMNFQGCKRNGDDRDDSIVIDEKGSYALILQDKTEAGQAKLTPGQKTTINSTVTVDDAESVGFELRIMDKADDASSMEPIWQTLKSKAASPPSLTAAHDGKLITGVLPEGEGVKKALESIK